ncbi:hypothetical protein ACLB2K_020884 [Fragaria x ananassa]
MKLKPKSPKPKLGLPTILLLCFLCFIAGLCTSTFLSQLSAPQFLSGPRSSSRMLESDEDEDHGPMLPGETGESSIGSNPFQVLSWKPRAVYFPGFATAEQCESVIRAAKAKLRPSTLALRKGETVESTKGTRTSSGTFISASEDETGVLDIIEQKIARATMFPTDHGEFASFLLYLSDVEGGGETMFPFENGSNMDIRYDYKKCIGLKVKPRQGDGLLFYSVLPNGTIDQTSLHGSCPVIRGEKWVATKWIRNQEED